MRFPEKKWKTNCVISTVISHFTATTIHWGCQMIRLVFRVLGMYNFGWAQHSTSWCAWWICGRGGQHHLNCGDFSLLSIHTLVKNMLNFFNIFWIWSTKYNFIFRSIDLLLHCQQLKIVGARPHLKLLLQPEINICPCLDLKRFKKTKRFLDLLDVLWNFCFYKNSEFLNIF